MSHESKHEGFDLHLNSLTKRELFAAIIMQGIVANNPGGAPGDCGPAALNAIKAADALIAKLGQQ